MSRTAILVTVVVVIVIKDKAPFRLPTEHNTSSARFSNFNSRERVLCTILIPKVLAAENLRLGFWLDRQTPILKIEPLVIHKNSKNHH